MTVSTSGTSANAATSVLSQIKATVVNNRVKTGTMGDILDEATKAVSSGPAPLFTNKREPVAGKVLLSSLVPSWDWKRKDLQDVYVTLGNADDYSEAQKSRIPSVNPYYRPNLDALTALAYAIEETDTPSLLTGPPSVGKSSLIEYFASITGRPFYRFNYNGTMDSSSLLGTQSASAGSTHWHDGMITEAIQVPYAIIGHDEWTFAPAEVIAALQYLLEKNGKLILADKPGTVADKTVYPAKGVRMVFADNTRGNGDATGKFIGTQPQNSATIDRIGTFIEVRFLPEHEEVAMLKGMYPEATDRLLGSCVKIANLCRFAFMQGNVSTILSLRVLTSWIQHALNLQDVDKALELAFLNRFDSEQERQTIKGFVNVTMGTGR